MSTRRNSIGGALDWSRMYRPTDRDTLRAAAAEMSSRGLLPRDIGTALELSEAAVRQLLEPSGVNPHE